MSEANSGMTIHSLVLKMTVSHVIVILFNTNVFLGGFKSISHISHPLVQLYKYQYKSNINLFQLVQQDACNSIRINSSM